MSDQEKLQENNEQENQEVAPAAEKPKDSGEAGLSSTNYIELSIERATATTTLTVASISILSITVIIYAVVMIYFGVYAYGNPDPNECFFVDGVESTKRSRAAIIAEAGTLGVEVRPGYPINMATLFRSWFMWGFWGSIFQIALVATMIPLCFLMKSQLPMLNITGGIVQGVICCNNIAWFFLGFFWRFSRAGRVAAGEKLERLPDLSNAEWQTQKDAAQEADGYQLRSGSFMSSYLWILIAVFLLSIVGGSVYAVMGCTQPHNAGKRDEGEAAASQPQTKGGPEEEAKTEEVKAE